MAEERSGKRLKEEKKQEMQQKSQEDVQREETFKTWLTGLHRRRKVCFREKVFIIGTWTICVACYRSKFAYKKGPGLHVQGAQIR